jgi:hypothetical protein
MRRGATAVLKWFSALYVVAIFVQLFLAGEGVFRLANIKNSDDCDKAGAHCLADSKTMDPHRALGFFLTLPGALLFLIVALIAWHPNKRIRVVSILAPILAFLQSVWAGIGGWAGGVHVVNAIFVLGSFSWLAVTLFRTNADVTQAAPEPVTTPAV